MFIVNSVISCDQTTVAVILVFDKRQLFLKQMQLNKSLKKQRKHHQSHFASN